MWRLLTRLLTKQGWYSADWKWLWTSLWCWSWCKPPPPPWRCWSWQTPPGSQFKTAVLPKEKQEEKEKETQEKQEKGLTQNSLLLLGWKRAINVRWFYWLISGYISRKKLEYLEAKINFNKTKTRYKTISKKHDLGKNIHKRLKT